MKIASWSILGVSAQLRAITFLSLLLWVVVGNAQKINGLSVVQGKGHPSTGWAKGVQRVGAGWVAIMPYALGKAGSSELGFDLNIDWLPKLEHYRGLIREAKSHGLKVMLKPMVWVLGGWSGSFSLEGDAAWKNWESAYRKYLLAIAKMAAEEHVELLSVGTELGQACRTRVKFFRSLIDEIRLQYSGKLTYAANWDEYLTVGLWDKLDYIGIDAYFPLSQEKQPDVKTLQAAWGRHLKRIAPLYLRHQKPILFTEFGYRSIETCCWEQWETEKLPHDQHVNLQGQANAYTAFFETFWNQPWFAGVFFWEWYTSSTAGGTQNSDFTPQGKPAEKVISQWWKAIPPEE